MKFRKVKEKVSEILGYIFEICLIPFVLIMTIYLLVYDMIFKKHDVDDWLEQY